MEPRSIEEVMIFLRVFLQQSFRCSLGRHGTAREIEGTIAEDAIRNVGRHGYLGSWELWKYFRSPFKDMSRL